jgi:putative addiction module killer protein
MPFQPCPWRLCQSPGLGCHCRTVALARLERGNLSNAKGVGEGVLEYRIDWGPGYRVYFGRDGDTLVILLTGGTKKRQARDIEAAKTHWADYKRRRKQTR